MGDSSCRHSEWNVASHLCHRPEQEQEQVEDEVEKEEGQVVQEQEDEPEKVVEEQEKEQCLHTYSALL